MCFTRMRVERRCVVCFLRTSTWLFCRAALLYSFLAHSLQSDVQHSVCVCELVHVILTQLYRVRARRYWLLRLQRHNVPVFVYSLLVLRASLHCNLCVITAITLRLVTWTCSTRCLNPPLSLSFFSFYSFLHCTLVFFSPAKFPELFKWN